ncbi:MAG: hypothetical protein HZB51_30420 [Chloroflexi bacterium]|nr:hypothetical protein [Chloroflexota bacterium]
MSSVLAVLSPTLNPGLAVLLEGNTNVIVFPEPGVMVSLLMAVVTAPPGKVTA